MIDPESDSSRLFRKPCPLSRDYQRTPKVEQDIAELLTCHFSSWPEKAKQKSESNFCYSTEALIYLIRELQSPKNGQKNKQKDKVIGELFNIIVERSKRHIAKKSSQLPQSKREEFYNDIYTKLAESVLSLDANCEFWEANYFSCLDRIMLTESKKLNQMNYKEQSPYRLDSNGEEFDIRDSIPDPKFNVSADRLIAQEMLGKIAPHIREAMILVYVEDYPQEKVAQHFGVTSRTIRNWLLTAKSLLQEE